MVVKHGRLVIGNKRVPLDYFERTKHISTINLYMAKKETKSKNVKGSRKHASRPAGMSSEMRVADNGATRVSEAAKLDEV